MKRFILVFFIILIVMTYYILNYVNEYSISDNTYEIQEKLESFINRPSNDLKETSKYIEIKQSINIDNKKYVLSIIDDSLGFAELTKGLNSKYKIYSVEHGGSGSFKGQVYKTNKAKYLIIYGKNTKLQIDYIKVSLEDKVYKIDVPKQEYYIVYSIVPDKNIISFPDITDYKFYNEDDVEVIIY